jgi:hypothetical protein
VQSSRPGVAGALALVLSGATAVLTVWLLVDGQWIGLFGLIVPATFAVVGWSNLRAARGEKTTPV